MNVTISTIQLKRGNKSAWQTKNPVLLKGEPGYELDTHMLKIGDGTTAWNDLPYVGGNTTTVNIGENMTADTENGVIYTTNSEGDTIIIAESTDTISLGTIQGLFEE